MKTTRRIVQLAFLLLTLVGVFVVRGNAERWCPFGGIEAIYTYVHEGNMICSLGVSNFYILGGVVLLTLLLRRAFCGYLCPIGTISDWLGRAVSRVGLPTWRVPRLLDRGLSLLKYAILFVILLFTYRTAELVLRGYGPCYALLGRHGEDITFWAYVITGGLVLVSLFVSIPFCRWLCPLAAVLNPLSRFGFTRIRRGGDACHDCGDCAAACPMNIPVDQVEQVTAARCMSCLNCVEACPNGADGAVEWGPPKRFGRRWPQAALIAIMLFCVGAAVAASYAIPLPSFVKTRGQAPAITATATLGIENLTCRGKATLLGYYLERDDEFALPEFLKIEAWPGPGAAKVHITYDPASTNEDAIKRAITEPYYDAQADIWRMSPFVIEGYDPLGLDY